ncbi:MAG: AarF/ABC1/UbiB kinase family protein [Planctomycetes bacterium]|nr:AarF/ABC1/UbiB kinase family protein [Planctomycetota bacterium]MCH9723890.1 AarF/ABC1/UbiB kinase family protein [Planctomycetota bacterium]MCH9778616.1 AarF/ABC1/UbiB kinase family protein [Planctomycetota bacterium]
MNYGFDDLVDQLGLRRYLRWGRRLLFWKRSEPEVKLTRAKRIRLALESLGVTFIKFGQVVSTRPDLVPRDVVRELSKLQESVPSFPSDVAIKIVERELEGSIDTLFAAFDHQPLAAGSLGQVHRARLHDGTELVVKIKRPDIDRVIEQDLSLMYELATMIERHFPDAEIFDPVGLVNQFSRTIHRELQFMREARSTDEFYRLFQDDATLYVPKIYWELTQGDIITMEYIDGYRIDNENELKNLPISAHEVAANGARIFMKMTFEFGIFHADPHPGNFRVMPDGSICLIDYGMIGVIEEERRDLLIDMLLNVARKDTTRLVEVVLNIGKTKRDVDHQLLRADLRDFIGNYYGIPLDQIKVGVMLTDFINILAIHRIRCPVDIMLLIRALITLEGVASHIAPDLNIAQEMEPYVYKISSERYHPRAIASRMWTEARSLTKVMHDLPEQIGRTLGKLSDDELRIHLEHKGIDHLTTEMDRSGNRLAIGMVMSALILASAITISSDSRLVYVSIPIFMMSSLLGIWLIYGVFRSGRL